MASTSPQIPMTIRIDNDLYWQFHNVCQSEGATHNGVVRMLIRKYVAEKESAKQTHSQRFMSQRSKK